VKDTLLVRLGAVAGLAATLLATAILSPLEVVRAKAAKPIELFNGRDLTGWTPVTDPGKDLTGTWTVRDGVIACSGKPRGYLRTNETYKNYRLRLQWRWPEKPGNSGVFVHGGQADKVWPYCFEAQLQAGNAGELRVNGGSRFHKDSKPDEKSMARLVDSSERAPGEWNDYEIVCRKDSVALLVNRVRQNVLKHATLKEGWIGLQSEGGAIEFRTITLEKL
jgi:hypothetical protein